MFANNLELFLLRQISFKGDKIFDIFVWSSRPGGDRLHGQLRRLWLEENGATMVEYGFMVAFIAAVCMAAVTTFGSEVRDLFILP